jgi:non-ribosomal peptide synthetase component F
VGIMRAGAAYVPLDPKLPLDRLQYLVEQCECSVVVALGKYAELAASTGVASTVVADKVLFDTENGGLSFDAEHVGVRQCGPGSLAYLLFTSGSTGKPKGVMLEHGSLVSFSMGTIEDNRLRTADTVLHVCSFT